MCLKKMICALVTILVLTGMVLSAMAAELPEESLDVGSTATDVYSVFLSDCLTGNNFVAAGDAYWFLITDIDSDFYSYQILATMDGYL